MGLWWTTWLPFTSCWRLAVLTWILQVADFQPIKKLWLQHLVVDSSQKFGAFAWTHHFLFSVFEKSSPAFRFCEKVYRLVSFNRLFPWKVSQFVPFVQLFASKVSQFFAYLRLFLSWGVPNRCSGPAWRLFGQQNHKWCRSRQPVYINSASEFADLLCQTCRNEQVGRWRRVSLCIAACGTGTLCI